MTGEAGADGAVRQALATEDPLAPRTVVLAQMTLCALGIAQPLLDLLGRNAAFFVAHGATAVDVVLLALSVAVVLPLVGGGLVLATAAVHRPTASALQSLALAGLTAAMVLAAFRASDTLGGVPAAAVLVLAAVAGVGVAVLYWRSAGARMLLRLAAVAAPAALLLFLFFTPANRILAPAQPAQAVTVAADSPPIVMVVFDELPVASLLDAAGEIDATAFPSFARLAEDATFYSNATTVHAQTMEAIPAIASGRRSRADELPTAADHPTSLMGLLGEQYRMHVVEPLTALCPPASCAGTATQASGLRRWRLLLRDLAIVEAHLLVPQDMAGSLPPVDEGWDNFAAAGGDGSQTRGDFLDQEREVRDRWPALFRRFVRGIKAAPEPTLHFLHVGLPHHPWIYLPDGRRYQAAPVAESGLAGIAGIDQRNRWRSRTWPVLQAYQRHLVQVQFVDRLLGEMLDQLQAQKLYERALVVVVADHGVSFRTDAPLRNFKRENIGEVAAVPLMVKLPRQTHGEISTLPAETTDIVPTVLDALEAQGLPEFDGESLHGDAIVNRTRRRITDPGLGTELIVPADHGQVAATVARKYALFGGSDHLDPFALAPPGYSRLLGVPAPSTSPLAEGAGLVLDRAAAFDDVDLDAPTLPALLSGSVTWDTGRPPVLAVAVNGTVVAITQTDPDAPAGDYPFRALLPPDAFREGANQVDVFIVEQDRRLLLVPAY